MNPLFAPSRSGFSVARQRLDEIGDLLARLAVGDRHKRSVELQTLRAVEEADHMACRFAEILCRDHRQVSLDSCPAYSGATGFGHPRVMLIGFGFSCS